LQPLPPPWDQYELDDPHVQLAYLNYVMAAVEFFRPRYVAIGVESNILLATDFSRWAGYKQLNAFIYTAIKRLHPELTVFVTIQYEHMLGLAGDSLRLAVQLQDIYPNVLEQEARALLQHSDLVALSTYPYIGYFITVTPAYYDRALFTARDLRKPLAIAETGYTTRNVFVDLFQESLYGSEEIQNSFLGYLLHAAQHHFFEFVVNYVPADYGTAYGVGAVTLTWAYTGLIREDGAPKPALATWDAFLRLPYARNGSGLGRK
jgi:hypothetical protein